MLPYCDAAEYSFDHGFPGGSRTAAIAAPLGRLPRSEGRSTEASLPLPIDLLP
jgi:hypothetical protein